MSLPQYTPNASLFHATISEVDDSNPPDAANWNPGTEALADNVANVRTSTPIAAQDWRANFTPAAAIGSSNSCAAGRPAWDPVTSRWLVPVTDLTTHDSVVYAGYGQDDGASAAWSNVSTGNLATLSKVPMGVSADASTPGKYFAAVASDGSNPNDSLTIMSVASPSSAWATSRTTISPGGLSQYTDVPMIVFNGLVIYAAGNLLKDPCTISSWDGTSWTDNVSGGALTGYGVALKSNGSQLMCCSPGTGDSPKLYTSTDGTTWTVTTLTFIGSGQTIAGLAWHASAGLWVLAVQTATSPTYTTAFYTSPDGGTWTEILGSAPSNVHIADLAYLGNTLVCTTFDASSAGPSQQIFSPDAGFTWYQGQRGFPTNLVETSQYYTHAKCAEAPTGLLAYNSEALSFSHLAGLPPTPLS